MALVVGRPVALLLAALVLGCGGGDGVEGPVDTNADVKRALLRALADEVIWPTYQEFDAVAQTLATATSAWSASATEPDRQAARAAWRAAMDVWQRAELFQIGPAGAMTATAGGEDLRDEVYSWPLVNRCRVDQELVEAVYDQPAFAQEAVNVRGLDALEYLLFTEGSDNDCAANSTINAEGSWQALDAATLNQRRANYAAVLARLVSDKAESLAQAWDPDRQDWGGQLAAAGAGSATFDTAQEALNTLTDAMFYLDTDTKDMKLAVPAGLSGCAEPVCPDALESRLSGRSRDNVLANLRGFLALFQGSEAGVGQGLDDLLVAVGRPELATQITTGIQATIALVEALPEDLSAALLTDQAAVIAAHDQLSDAFLPFKTELLSVLDLELPQRAEGDND